MSTNKSKKIFTLELSKDSGRLKVCAYEKSSDDEKTIRHHEFKKIGDDAIKGMCATVVNLLNRANYNGKINHESLKELQTAGHLLYDSLLTGRVKEKLHATDAENLMINIDDHLVHIPWEIMYDGSRFMCQRFNMGRVVSTSQKISEPTIRRMGKPLNMLVVSDPRGDLEASYTEGIRIRDTLDLIPESIEINLRSSQVDVKHFKGMLRDFDIVHYAGHADYDVNNPSDSGFLLHDGKLKAADIIDMIGPAPLPSMVFSNACKSGHSDEWRVEQDYETEIYGLANAFLLAGVQHYIGTFWDVQDEPSLYFALDFYRELMDGALVGEAMRKARLRLIERYGEDTIIWASYMLYGDPTARYVDLNRINGSDENVDEIVSEKITMDEEVVVRGSVRSRESAVTFPSRKNKLLLTGSILLLVVSLITVFITFNREKSTPLKAEYVLVKDNSEETKDRRIDELVASLIEKYHEDQRLGKRTPIPVEGGIPTIAFLNIKTIGINDSDGDFVTTKMISLLQRSKRVKVVERDIIDKLLEELKLSSSQLADQQTALKVGRILSVNLLSTGSITRDNNDWQISLRFIETETTTIKAALAEILESKDIKEIPVAISKEILAEIRSAYPLQGKVISINDEVVVVDVGQKNGAFKGMKIRVFSGTNGMGLGELELMSTGETISNAKVVSQRGVIKEGMSMEEII